MKKLRNNRTNYLPLIKAVMVLAGPTMLEQLMQTAVQYIDIAMLGRLGTYATAAAGATTTVNWLILLTVSAVGVGFLSLIAQAQGAGETEKMRAASAQALLAVLVTGILYTALAVPLSGRITAWMQVDESIRQEAARYFLILYIPMLPRAASIIFGTILRASGDTKTPMRVGFLMNSVNVVLNFLLIYGPREVFIAGQSFRFWGAGFGVAGAAAASAASYAVGGLLMTAALWRTRDLSPRGLSLRPDAAILRRCFGVAGPYILQSFGTAMGYIVFAAMINSLGEISTAAHTVANTVESAFYIPGYGMQTAAASMTGNAIGAGDRVRLRNTAGAILTCETALMVTTGALLFVFAPAMVRLFSSDPEVIRLGGTVLRMVACSEPFYGVSIVIEGMLQGAGRTDITLRYNIIGMWGIRILGTLVCTKLLHLSLISAWACMIAHNMLLFALYVLLFRKAMPRDSGSTLDIPFFFQ